MDNKNDMTPSMHYGNLDFENYWGEKLFSVEIIHYLSDIINVAEIYSMYKKIMYVDDKTKVTDAMRFKYSLGDLGYLDYWKIKIITDNNEVYSSNGSVRCSIRPEDNGKVIMGVNGESKRMYISMVSGSCSISLNKVS
ncbi:hypothetical protein [Providencia manganoxydans]|uniref:hypothetical protein n=1 Tax=Providencia manganoxydans TaxID=2923283 RepID=UPI00280E206F|nr:hypothetical protein [Providencia stuartii]